MFLFFSPPPLLLLVLLNLLLQSPPLISMFFLGIYSLDERAPIPEWYVQPNDPRQAIRIVDLMRMSSGLLLRGSFDPDFDPSLVHFSFPSSPLPPSPLLLPPPIPSLPPPSSFSSFPSSFRDTRTISIFTRAVSIRMNMQRLGRCNGLLTLLDGIATLIPFSPPT